MATPRHGQPMACLMPWLPGAWPICAMGYYAPGTPRTLDLYSVLAMNHSLELL